MDLSSPRLRHQIPVHRTSRQKLPFSDVSACESLVDRVSVLTPGTVVPVTDPDAVMPFQTVLLVAVEEEWIRHPQTPYLVTAAAGLAAPALKVSAVFLST